MKNEKMTLKSIRWDPVKAKRLREDKTRRGVSFEDCVVAIEGGGVLAITLNPSKKHRGQWMYVLNFEGYAYVVPFEEREDIIDLITVFPSRKYTRDYLGKKTP